MFTLLTLLCLCLGGRFFLAFALSMSTCWCSTLSTDRSIIWLDISICEYRDGAATTVGGFSFPAVILVIWEKAVTTLRAGRCCWLFLLLIASACMSCISFVPSLNQIVDYSLRLTSAKAVESWKQNDPSSYSWFKFFKIKFNSNHPLARLESMGWYMAGNYFIQRIATALMKHHITLLIFTVIVLTFAHLFLAQFVSVLCPCSTKLQCIFE